MASTGFDLLRYGAAIGRMMSEWYAYTREVLHQSSDLGFSREHFVHHVLANILPKSVVIGSGEIVDGEGHRSGQQDVIIYRSDFPVITSLTPVNTYLVEGVVATIEVKSDLSTGTPNHLVSGFRNVASVSKLQKAVRVLHGSPDQVALLQRVSSQRTFIIGYEGWKSTEALLQNYSNGIIAAAGAMPHLVCQPGNCVVVDDGFLNPGAEVQPGRVMVNREHPYAVLLHYLLKVVMLNTGGTLVTAPGVDAIMNYYLDRYFNFDPPIPFEYRKFVVVPSS